MLEPESSCESYDSYIRLPTLLAAQHPRSSSDDRPVWAAERSFIVCHQISELCLSQVLLDVDLAAHSAGASGDWSATCDHLVRAASLTAVLARILGQLATVCPAGAFMRFRTILQGISASESRQFRDFLRLLDGTYASIQALRAALQSVSADTSGDEARISGGSPEHRQRAAHALSLLLRLATVWRALHVVIAKHFIRDLPGTGGTTGVAYLSKRFAKDFGHAGCPGPSRATTPSSRSNGSAVPGAFEPVESQSIDHLLDLIRGLEGELRVGSTQPAPP